MIQGKLFSYGDDLSEIYNIRRKVFIEELAVPEDIEFDDLDNEAIHVLVYEEASNINSNDMTKKKIPVATGRIVYEGDSCKIDHIAVLNNYRNLKYGDFTVKMLINRAFTAGISTVTLTAKKEIEGFFKKIGFEAINYNLNYNTVDMIIKEYNVKRLCGR